MKHKKDIAIAVALIAAALFASMGLGDTKTSGLDAPETMRPVILTATPAIRATVPNITVEPTEAPEPTPSPTQTPKPPYGEVEVTMLAKVVWAEARGVPTTAEKAAVIWCVLNRVDADGYGDSIAEVITARNQFAYREASPATDELTELARDVLDRWWREHNGEADVGRVLPAEYTFFCGDGKHNHFRTEYEDTGVYWDWSLPSPYGEEEPHGS